MCSKAERWDEHEVVHTSVGWDDRPNVLFAWDWALNTEMVLDKPAWADALGDSRHGSKQCLSWAWPLWAPACPHTAQPTLPSHLSPWGLHSITIFQGSFENRLWPGTDFIFSMSLSFSFSRMKPPLTLVLKWFVIKEKTGSWYELRFWYIWAVKIIPFKLHPMQISVPKKPK